MSKHMLNHETFTRVHEDGSCDSICKKCDKVLARGVTEPEAHRAGMAHYREHYKKGTS